MMDTIENLFKEWDQHLQLIKEIDVPYKTGCGNVNLCVERFRALAEFLMQNLGTLREWMMTYLEEHRKEIFLTFWMNHIHKWMLGHLDYFQREILYPQAEAEWDRVFGEEYPFSLALQRARDLQAIFPIEKCDDVVIKRIHEGKPHNGNGFICDWCEDQEWQWHKEVKRRMTNSSHALLSGTLTHYRKNMWLNKVSTWEPPHLWGWNSSREPCHNLDEYKQSIRQRAVTEEHQGLTPIQRLHKLLPTIMGKNGWCAHISYSKTPHDRFFQLWNSLDLILFTIQLDLPRLVELEVDYQDWGSSKLR